MKIEFIKDYIGRETTMTQFYEGETVDMAFPQASALIKIGVAVEVVEVVEETEQPKLKHKRGNHDKNSQ